MSLKIIRPSYLSANYEERNVWLQNFTGALAQYAGPLGVTNEQMSKLLNGAAQYNYLVVTLIPAARAFSKSLTQFMENADTDDAATTYAVPAFTPPVAPVLSSTLDTGIFNMVTSLVTQTILPSPALTPTIKSALGLDPLPTPAPNQVAIRSFEVASGGRVDLTLMRSGAPLIIVEGRRGDETGFTMLDKVASGHYVDARPNLVPGLAELRDYRVQRSDGSQSVGVYSPVVTVPTLA